MVFYTESKTPRPVRLCEATRQFAWDSLHHKYGLDTAKTDAVAMDDVPGFAVLPPLDRYDMAIRRIAEEAPLRICPGELVSGAATLGMAIRHRVPATYAGKEIFVSISHLTVDFETVLRRGVDGIREDIRASLARHTEPDKVRFLHSCMALTDSMELWRARYIDALNADHATRQNADMLSRVPFAPAANFREAVQSLWFTFAFLRLCGNWPGFGRLDWLLGDYLQADLAAGELTLDEAREILAHFFIKGCEWVKGGDYGSGDAQHYQNIVLCGIDGEGSEVTNEVTYLVLDIIEELGISDFPTTLRLNKNTDEKLLRRAAEVVKFGGGVLAFYDEDSILRSLKNYGYPADEVWRFANDGCWEIQIPGKTCFGYSPFDALRILQRYTLQNYAEGTDFADFESLYRSYIAGLKEHITWIIRDKNRCLAPRIPGDGWHWLPQEPCTAVSVFEQGCIEKGRSYLEGGPVYNVQSPHIGGLPDAVNSLYAIRKLVFDDKKVTFPEFIRILREDWAGAEELRRSMLNDYVYYGNDNDECDAIAVRLIDDFAALCKAGDGESGYMFPPGISTFGRQLEWAPERLASPHGRKAHERLAANASPTPGTDREGATAIIRSYGKADLTKMVTGAALDVKLTPSVVEGEDGTAAIVALLRGFVAVGGSFLQPDVQDAEILRQAQAHPEEFPTLSVRVSGWNARFVTLNKEWQDMIIHENEHG